MPAKLPMSSLEALLEIAADPDASVILEAAHRMLGPELDRLCADGALTPVGNLKDLVILEDGVERYVDIERYDGRNVYFSPSDGRVTIPDEKITLLGIQFDWLVREIMNALGLPSANRAKALLDNQVWELGKVRIDRNNSTVLVARHVTEAGVFSLLSDYLAEHNSASDPALVIALDRYLPDHFHLLDSGVLIKLEDAVLIDHEEFALNVPTLSLRLRRCLNRAVFSSGFRTATVGGTEYQFSPKQSAVVEYLYNEGRAIHQHEILAEVHSTQKKLLHLFRKNGTKHPAWGTLIKSTGTGFYVLDTEQGA